MLAKTLTLSALLAVATATLSINNGIQARDVARVLEKRAAGDSCTLGDAAASLYASLPTPPADLTNVDPCNVAAITSLAGSPAFASYTSALISWETAHASDIASLASSVASACTADPSLLSSLSESLAANPTGDLTGSACSTTDGSGAGLTTGTSTPSGSSESTSSAGAAGLTTSTSTGSKTATTSTSSSSSSSSSASGNGGSQQTMAAYAGAAIIGAMGVIAAL
jgi:hypothetical protein